jgi:hypothetical protein
MARGCQVVFDKMYLGLYECEFVAEVSEAVVLSLVALQLGGGVSVVEVGDGAAEGVEGRGWSTEQTLEPAGKWLGDVRG